MELDKTELPALSTSLKSKSKDILKEKTPLGECKSRYDFKSSASSTEQSFIDATLSEEQLLAIIDEQASMGNKDPGKSPDDVLRMIDENNSLVTSPLIEHQENINSLPSLPNIGSAFPGIPTYQQNNYMANLSNLPPPTSYLPYFPMNFYHHQILIDQAAQQAAHKAYYNHNSASGSQLDYNQNLDNYIETVFENENEPNESNSLYVSYSSNSIPVESKDNGTGFISQASSETGYKTSMNFQNDPEKNHVEEVFQPQPTKFQISQNGASAFQPVIPENSNSSINQYFNNFPHKISKLAKPVYHHPFHNKFAPTGSINKIGALPSFPPNTTLIPYQQPNVYLISNQSNAMPKVNKNFQYMISPPKIAIRPPLRTKRSNLKNETMTSHALQKYNNASETPNPDDKHDYFSKMDFSSLDTSDIVISKIVTPEVPLHKNRKQPLKFLTDSDITYECSELTKKVIDNSPLKNISSSIKVNTTVRESIPEKNMLKTSPKLKANKSNEFYNGKRLKKYDRKHRDRDSGFGCYTDNEDDSSLEDSGTDKNISKSLKCLTCMKMFKSSQTLAKHRKTHPVEKRNSADYNKKQLNENVKEMQSKTVNRSNTVSRTKTESRNETVIQNEIVHQNENVCQSQIVSHTDLLKESLQSYCEKSFELNQNKTTEIEQSSEVENSLAALFAEKTGNDEENIYNSMMNENDGDDDIKIQDRVEASLAVLFSEGPSRREFEKSCFEKCSEIENNEIIKYNNLRASWKKQAAEKLANKKNKKNILVDQTNVKNDQNCNDLLKTLNPTKRKDSFINHKLMQDLTDLISKQFFFSENLKSRKKLTQKILKNDISKEPVVQNTRSTSVQNDNQKKIITLKQEKENVLEENNHKRKTRSQTKRKNEIETVTTNNKRKK